MAIRRAWLPRRMVSCSTAITFSRTGDSSVLQLSVRDIVEPGAGEVRVRVAVSGVNPTDWKRRSGAAGVAGLELDFPEVVPNQDGAGVVDAIGPNVTGLAVGDLVGFRQWSAAGRGRSHTGGGGAAG